MAEDRKNLQQTTAVYPPRLVIPGSQVDLACWAVIACDQHTSPNDDYWQKAAELVGDSPSTLNLVFPEFYLKDAPAEIETRVVKIQETMKVYLAKKILTPLAKPGFVYLQRKLSTGRRDGLLVNLDLENYSFEPGDKPLIRPTEGTIKERLPVRIKIREGAPLEFPHIMMLVDDPQKTVIEPLANQTGNLEKLFDFDLMLGGGHLTAYFIESPEIETKIYQALAGLADPEKFRQKYGAGEEAGLMLIAAGDGNHSLATAKAVWEETKSGLIAKNEPWENHPARFALVELVNLYSTALVFEPIHRVLYHAALPESFLEKFSAYYQEKGSRIELKEKNSVDELARSVRTANTGQTKSHFFGLSYFDRKPVFKLVSVIPPLHTLPVGSLQPFLDAYLKENPQAEIDYLHSQAEVTTDSLEPGNYGFFLPAMDKTKLFEAVLKNGVTPRKTFSMGSAETKAYYLFGRVILPCVGVTSPTS